VVSTYMSYQLVTRDIGKSLARVEKQPMVQRETEYYLANIGKVTTPEEFIKDTRLFNYAMKAFGLQDMAYAKGFMLKALKEGVSDPDSFANKLADKRYAEFVRAYDFVAHGDKATTFNPAQHTTVDKYLQRATAGGVIPQTEMVKKETAYFLEHIVEVTSIDEFLKNDRLYEYAMWGFRIDPSTTTKDFMRKVLEGGTADPNSFANKLTDENFAAFAAAFDFAGHGAEATTYSPASVAVSNYMRQTLEENAGTDNEGVRLALYFERKASTITSFYQVLADPALAEVVRTVLALPDEIAQADIDKQVQLMERRLDLADFQDPEKLARFLTRFSAMWDIDNTSAVATSPATILMSQPVTFGVSIDTLMAIATMKR